MTLRAARHQQLRRQNLGQIFGRTHCKGATYSIPQGMMRVYFIPSSDAPTKAPA